MGTLQDCINLVSVFLVVIIANIPNLEANQAGRHTYVVRYRHGDSLIPVTVVLDYKRQTEYVINMHSRTPSKSVTLYDFKERVIAYKDLKNGECFIGRLNHETIDEEDEVLKRLKSPVEGKPVVLSLDPNRPSLTPTEVRNMAGHKAAVFCRRMNTWTLKPGNENRRERRDTSSYGDRSLSRHDEFSLPEQTSQQSSGVFRTEHDKEQRNRTHRDFFNFYSNGSAIHRTAHLEAASSLETSVPVASSPHQSLPDGFPFILRRQSGVPEISDERRGPRQNLNVYTLGKKIAADNAPHFSFTHGRSSARGVSEFSEPLLPSSLENGTTLTSSTRHAFIPLQTNRPLIIPSISATGKFAHRNSNYGASHISPPSVYPQNNAINFPPLHSAGEAVGNYPPLHSAGEAVGNYPPLHSAGEAVGNYPPFQQLPPEAFILPLTRSSTATTTPFLFNNRVGYELVHQEGSNSYNKTDIETGHRESSNDSADGYRSLLTERSGQQPVFDLSPLSFRSSGNNNVPERIASVSSHDQTAVKDNEDERKALLVGPHAKTPPVLPENSFDGTGKNFSEESTPSSKHFEDTDFIPVHRGDLPVHVPRWYPEITKQISIPVEIEVLHHREEYLPDIGNRTDVHAIRGHEIEEHSSLPKENTVIPILTETHSNGVGFQKDLKLLPQVSRNADDGSPSKNTSNQVSDELDRKGHPKVELGYSTENNNHPTYRKVSNTTMHQAANRTSSTLTNGSEIPISGTNSPPHFEGKQNYINETTHPALSYGGAVDHSRSTPKRQHNISTVPVHDFKIDEGVPSYRKRYPAVTQLFTPDEVVSDIGRLPDRRHRLDHQSTRRMRKPSTLGNKTRSLTGRGQESNFFPGGKPGLEPRSFVDRQQTRLRDQGITFHHRGYPKAGVPGIPYEHHRKGFGVLPPGVSVHPRHPQAPYADLATGSVDKDIPLNPMLNSQPRRIHLRHHRRHQRRRNRVLSSPDSSLPISKCCGEDGFNCCSGSRRGRRFPKAGCCSQMRENRRPNSVLRPQKDKNEVSPRKQVKVEDVEEDRCMKEKMCRTVYQSTKKVLVCRSIEVDGC